MHEVELISVTGGYWAAHCEELKVGSLSLTRQGAMYSLSRLIDHPDERPQHPEYTHKGDKIYPLRQPGYYDF